VVLLRKTAELAIQTYTFGSCLHILYGNNRFPIKETKREGFYGFAGGTSEKLKYQNFTNKE
jgi:hypothetical protein